ncbi:hypothetical protein SCB49_00485 [unidentified eubacterium SCB49]|nr:hypothetical protein SCB49_00485 [unidentified eubacterium SCB49]
MKLIVLKSAFRFFPEVLLSLVVLYYWSLTSSVFNPIAILFLIPLMVLFLWNNKTLGLITAFVFLMATLYLSLALFSDLIKIESFYPEGLKRLVEALLFLGFSSFASILMLFKHSKKAPGRIIIN